MTSLLKNVPPKTIKEAIWIILVATLLGFLVNLFHPNKIQISGKRPSLPFAADTVPAQDLPGVMITANSSEQEKMVRLLFINTAELIQLNANNQVLLIDVQSQIEFLKAHLPGAKNFPPSKLLADKAKLDSLPQEKWLVCYGNEPGSKQAELVAGDFVTAGYKFVAIYYDGLVGWKKAGYEIEGKKGENYAK